LEVIYGEGVRAIERQGRRLDESRARTGVVLTAGSISASLLGAVSLREKGSLGAWAWSGVGAFAVLGLLAAWLLAPSTDWTFSLEPKWMLRRYVDGDVVEAHLLSSLYRETAECADEYYVKNEAKSEVISSRVTTAGW
jgi:hypothetical protein